MATRIVEGKKPYIGGKAIEITEDKVINLRLRDENNLIIYDAGDDEIYVDLQLPDEITPTDAFPVGVTTGRVIVDNGWDAAGTIICAKTTSGDNIKILYEDNGKLYIDNGTGTFKQIYLKGEVDALLQSLRNYVDTELAKKQDKLIAGENITIAADGKTISATTPPMSRFLSLWNCATGQPISFPADIPFEYITGDHFLVDVVSTATPAVNLRPDGSSYTGTASITPETENVKVGDVYIYDGTVWLLQKNSGDGGVTSVNGQTGSVTVNEVPSGGTTGQILTKDANGYDWANAPESSNTKAFYLSSLSDLTNAQAAYDWYTAGKNPILVYSNRAYILVSADSSNVIFRSSNHSQTDNASYSAGKEWEIKFYLSSGTVTSYSNTNKNITPNVLATDVDYSTPYTPAYNGSPVTKKYLVDSLTSKQDVLTAGTNINISPIMESDMKGPCPSGFHVPLQSEWNNIITAYRQFGLNDSNFYIYFKIAKAGYYVPSPESGQDGSYRSAKGSSAYLWTNTVFNSTVACVNVGTRPATNLYLSRCYGCNIRAFANTAIAPDSLWTTLYDGSSTAIGAGIFHNSTLGVISISSDGTTWYTIADKNVGATAVYNDGDTRSQSNCGCIFQWGNNYMFPYITGRLSPKSLSKVDVSGYGPGNYYSSDTFIVVSNQDWSSVQNDDLWGADNPGTFADGTEISAIVPAQTVVSGDAGVTYTIKVSNSDPASGTAINIITLVP